MPTRPSARHMNEPQDYPNLATWPSDAPSPSGADEREVREVYSDMLHRLHWKAHIECNLSCPFCYLWRGPAGTPLSSQDAMLLISEASMLFEWFLFGGGDPLLRRDILALVKHAKAHGLKVELQTNAVRIGTPFVPSLLSHLDRLGLSLDGPDAQIHDSIRRSPGSFAKQLRALSLASRLAIPTTVRSLVLPQNLHSIRKIGFLLSDYPCVTEWKIREFVPLGRGLQTRASYRVSPEEFAYLRNHIRESTHHAGAPFRISIHPAEISCRESCIHLSADGTAYGNPTTDTYHSVGRFPEFSLRELLHRIMAVELSRPHRGTESLGYVIHNGEVTSIAEQEGHTP